jgi:hypothetical protein
VKKSLIALLAIVCAIGIGWAVVEQALQVNKFGGMLKDIDPLTLPDEAAADSENVITDLGSGIQPRDGYISYSTEPSKALWVFAKSNGTRYLITHSGNSLKADSGDKTFSVTISTVAPSIVTAGSQLGDYFYFCNTVDGLKRWDGTTVTVASASMTMNQLVTWKGRLVGAGKPGAERTLFISRYLDGTAWTLAIDPSDDDPAQITVGGSLDENISGLYASYKDLLIWFKNTSFGGLFGSRRSNFALRTFSESVGTNHPGTVRDCDGLLRFLGPRRTVWEFDGSNLSKISEGNNELFDSIINGESNSRSATVTSQADYTLGSFNQTTATRWPGSVSLIAIGTNVFNNDFEDGTGTTADYWSSGFVSGACGTLCTSMGRTSAYGVYSGSFALGAPASIVPGFGKVEVNIVDSNNNVLQTSGNIYSNFNTSSWTQATFTLTGLDRQQIKIQLVASTDVGTNLYKSTSSLFTCFENGTPFAFSVWGKRYSTTCGGSPCEFFAFDLAEGGRETVYSSGTFVSATQSMGSSISSWNVFQRDESLNGGTITYGFYTDTDTTKTIGGDGLPVVGTYTSSQTITNDIIPTISTAPYAFFSAKFDITASTQDPTNGRLSIAWDEGSSLKAKSVWTKQRYWLSVSRAATAYNDTVFVYDRQKQWQHYTGLNALDIQLHNSCPMIGSASGISQGETGTSDAGSAITSSYTTKYFFPNGAEMRAYLRDLWMTTTHSDATLSTYLYHDGAATPITLGSFVMNEQEGYQVKKLPIPAGDLQLVRHVAIKWNVSGTERWKILNGSLYFDPDTQRE